MRAIPLKIVLEGWATSIFKYKREDDQKEIRIYGEGIYSHLTPGSAVLILQVGESTLVRSHVSTLSITCKVGQTMSCTVFSVLCLSEQRCPHSGGHVIYASFCHQVLNNQGEEFCVFQNNGSAKYWV